MARGILQSVWQGSVAVMMAASICTIVTATLLLLYCASVQAGTSESLTSEFPYSRLDNSPVMHNGAVDGFPFSVQAAESVPEQYDPLSSIMDIEFGESIVSVGDAVKQVLQPLGFELVSEGRRVSLLLPELLAEPLPQMQRSMRHLRAREILRTLAGPGYVVVVDVVHRAITFDPKPRYASIGQESTPDIQPVSIVPVLPEKNIAPLVNAPITVPQPWDNHIASKWIPVKGNGDEWVKVVAKERRVGKPAGDESTSSNTLKKRLIAAVLHRLAQLRRQPEGTRAGIEGLDKPGPSTLGNINRCESEGDTLMASHCRARHTSDSKASKKSQPETDVEKRVWECVGC